LLLKNRVTSDQQRLAIQKKHVEEMKRLLPFYETIESLMEDKRLMKRPDGEKAAPALSAIVKCITEEQKADRGQSAVAAAVPYQGPRPESHPFAAKSHHG
jgi:hypothetical protein